MNWRYALMEIAFFTALMAYIILLNGCTATSYEREAVSAAAQHAD